MKAFTQTIRQFGLITTALTIALLANFTFAAWNNPAVAPTGGNVAAPLNVGTDNQVKQGNLDINRLSLTDTFPSVTLSDTDAGGGNGLIAYNNNILSLYNRDVTNGVWRWSMQLRGANLTDPTSYYALFQNNLHANAYCDKAGGNCFTSSDVQNLIAASTTNNSGTSEMLFPYTNTTASALTHWRMNANDGTANWSQYHNSEGTNSPTYETSGYAFKEIYNPGGGVYKFQTSNGSGSAGQPITWNDALVINPDGSVVINDLTSNGLSLGDSMQAPPSAANVNSLCGVGVKTTPDHVALGSDNANKLAILYTYSNPTNTCIVASCTLGYDGSNYYKVKSDSNSSNCGFG